MKNDNQCKNTELFEIRDNRGNKRYFIDDVFDDEYARVVGPYAYAIYASLCKHANKKQKAWPGVDALAERLGMGRKSVFAALEILEFLKIIRRERVGKKCTNRYTLLDRSKWLKQGCMKSPTGTSQKNSEVPLRYFSSSSGELHQFLWGTSIVRKPIVRKPKKGIVPQNGTTPEIEKKICKEEGCKNEVLEGSDYCKLHVPMALDDFVEWCGRSEQAHIRIIGEWAETVKPNFRNQGQWSEYIRRYARTASNLVPFDHCQLSTGFAEIKRGIKEKWLTNYTLETLYKFVTGVKIAQ
jgi:hypothetical protein